MAEETDRLKKQMQEKEWIEREERARLRQDFERMRQREKEKTLKGCETRSAMVRILEHFAHQECVGAICDQLMLGANRLMKHPYGNLAVSYVVRYGSRLHVIGQLVCESFFDLAENQHSSYVIVTCIDENLDEEWHRKFAEAYKRSEQRVTNEKRRKAICSSLDRARWRVNAPLAPPGLFH
jgi:hypothetical protein